MNEYLFQCVNVYEFVCMCECVEWVSVHVKMCVSVYESLRGCVNFRVSASVG